jgi:DNA-binding Lrp family transcriptional regulator
MALGECVRKLDAVVESYRVTGTGRLILKVVAESVTHLDEIPRTLASFGTPTASIVLAVRSRPVPRVSPVANVS